MFHYSSKWHNVWKADNDIKKNIHTYVAVQITFFSSFNTEQVSYIMVDQEKCNHLKCKFHIALQDNYTNIN